MSELIAKLRAKREGFGHSIWVSGAPVNPDGEEAAQAIASLQARLAEIGLALSQQTTRLAETREALMSRIQRGNDCINSVCTYPESANCVCTAEYARALAKVEEQVDVEHAAQSAALSPKQEDAAR